MHMANASEDDNHDPSFVPVVQILKIAHIGKNGATSRFRVILSDGKHKAHGMLATQNNADVEEGKISTNTIIRVQDYMKNIVQDKTLLILLSFDEGLHIDQCDQTNIMTLFAERPPPVMSAGTGLHRNNAPRLRGQEL